MASYDANIRIGVTGLEQLNKTVSAVNKLSQQLEKRFAVAINTQDFDKIGVTLNRVANTAAIARKNLENVNVNNWAELRGAVKRVVDTLELQRGVQAKINKELDIEIAKRNQLKTAVQANVAASRQSREASDFGLGSAGDPVAKSIRRQQEKQARERERFLRGSQLYAEPALPGRAGSPQEAAGAFRAGIAKLEERDKLNRELLEQAAIKELQQIEKAAVAGIAADNKVYANVNALDDAYWKKRLANAERARKAEEAIVRRDTTRASLDTSGRGRRRELERTGGLSFDERLARRRPDLASPATARSQSRQLRNILESASIGGGFPLLFGQGAGTSFGGLIGGGLGGAIGGGGGFAGGIIGSVVGQQFDNLKKAAVGMAEALREPTALLEAMGAAGITTSTALKNTVAALEATGRGAEAQALVFAELERLGGSDYVQNLLELEEANKALQDQWSQLSVALQKELLPWFIELTNAATELAKVFAALAPGLKLIGPVLEAAFTAANPFGALSLLKNGGRIAAGPSGSLASPEKQREPQISDTQQRKALDEAIARQKEAEDLRRRGIQLELSQIDFRIDQEEAIFNLRKRAADLEREADDFRYSLETRIAKQKDEIRRKEADNARQLAQLAIDRTDLALQQAGQLPFEQGGGESPFVAAAREYIRVRAEGEADLRQKEVETQIKVQELKREGNDFERETAKKVREFSDKAEQFARDVTKYEWEQQKKIYALQLEVVDQQYAVWENAYKRAVDIANLQREGAANPLGDVSNAANPNFQTQYMRRLALLESDGGRNWTNPSSGAAGFFQFLPSTLDDVENRGITTKAAALSKNFDTAAKAALDYAMAMDPAIKQLMAAGDVAGLDRRLNRLWTSLPGGAEEASAERMARANRLIGGSGYQTGRTGLYQGNTGRSRGDHFHVDRGYGGGYVSESEARRIFANSGSLSMTSGYGARGGTHKGVDLAGAVGTPLNLAAGYRLKSFERSTGPTGNFAWVIGPNNELYRILHLADPPPGWKAGAVAAGGAASGVFDPIRPSAPRPLPPRRAGGQGPAELPQLPGAVDVSGLVDQSARLNEQQQQLLQTELAIAKARKEFNDLAAKTGLDNATAAALQNILKPILDANKALEDRLAYDREYSELLQKGILPAQAEATAQLNSQVRIQGELLDSNIAALELAIAKYEIEVKTTEDVNARAEKMAVLLGLTEQYAKLLRGKDALQGLGDKGRALIEENNSPDARRRRAVDSYQERVNALQNTPLRAFEKLQEAKADLAELIDPLNQVLGAADALGNAFGDAFQSIISGSESADEALKKMFANIGSYFLNMATQMLAQRAITGILGLLSGGAGAAAGGGFQTGGLFNLALPGFAQGGHPPVGRPSIVGEEGPELFVPGLPGRVLSFDDTRDAINQAEGIIAAADEAGIETGGASSVRADGRPMAAGSRAARAFNQNGQALSTVNNAYNSNEQSSAFAANNQSLSTINSAYNATQAGSTTSQSAMFSDTRSAIQNSYYSNSNPFAVNADALKEVNSTMMQRETERMLAESIGGSFEPIEVKVDAFDPAGAGLVTIGQLVESNRRSVAEAQAKMQSKMRNSPQFRKGVGLK